MIRQRLQAPASAQPAQAQEAAVAASFIGDYALALECMDSFATPLPRLSPADSLYFRRFAPRSAHAYIIERARHERIVLLNEAHHVPLHRVFTLSLLADLYAQGYRYFGAETLNGDDRTLMRRGYAATTLTDYYLNTGYYSAEPQYGNLIHEALRLGFTVFAYEAQFNAQTPLSAREREMQQARHIQQILAADPTAKVVLQAGYDHIREDSVEGWGRAMAGRVREFTGINPFTINQEKLTEKSAPRWENPYYRLVLAQEPSVLVDAQGQAFSGPPGTAYFDVRVYHPPTRYEYGRPHWLQLAGRRKPYFLKRLPPSLTYPCLVFAYRAQEDARLAVAADIIELNTATEGKALLLEPGPYRLRLQSSNGTSTYQKIRVK
ncbi:hypothetical protein [Hymenobacter sp. YC55]|uniref:hypothetical protein n=1 Tax=Hymenobacter sp. YC55 TaxID=3034019 RepID=UPI0023F791C2|nr:hypothetical protein [Hymenobacter sp. YC55]MDF7813829.1 hypothetical protein [Hymenobacter sp. YC55]